MLFVLSKYLCSSYYDDSYELGCHWFEDEVRPTPDEAVEKFLLMIRCGKKLSAIPLYEAKLCPKIALKTNT